jgi:hypothetical protein
MVHRADLLDVLRGALKTVDFRLGARCIGSEIEADIIVGAPPPTMAIRGARLIRALHFVEA